MIPAITRLWLIAFSMPLLASAQQPPCKVEYRDVLGHPLDSVEYHIKTRRDAVTEFLPYKKDVYARGVNTLDLLLICQHLMGRGNLHAPYAILAADINRSQSVTSFDLMELRKIVLGKFNDSDTIKINDFPKKYAQPWRFVPKNHTFPNPLNPFQEVFPEAVNCVAPQSSTVEFVGIKVGDVNNSAVPNARPGELPATSLAWPTVMAQPGSVVTFPVSYNGSQPVEALQFGLRFDPRVLQLISPSIGDLESYTADNFNLLRAEEGEIRTLWLPLGGSDERIRPGTVLFHLSFKVLGNLPENQSPLRFDDELLECLAWEADGTEYRLQHNGLNETKNRSLPENAAIRASVSPNPTTGGATMLVQAESPEKARIMLFDAFGRRLSMQQLMLVQGSQEIALPEVQNLPTGVYVWKIFTPTKKAQGHLVKQ
ncbi:MAG: cohesin domain-containing protein [Saprospiraceae bacterium]|nr:cohesin domain-containing protein [Saprospiraceae bacterium]